MPSRKEAQLAVIKPKPKGKSREDRINSDVNKLNQ